LEDSCIGSLQPVPLGHRLYKLDPMPYSGSMSRIDFGMDSHRGHNYQMPCALVQMESS